MNLVNASKMTVSGIWTERSTKKNLPDFSKGEIQTRAVLVKVLNFER